MIKKKGIFFTFDALLACTILVTSILLIHSYYIHAQADSNVEYMAEDVLSVISNLKMNELNNTYAQSLLNGSEDPNTTVIEQIGTFWAKGDINTSRNLTRAVLDSVVPGTIGYGIWIEDELIYSRNISEINKLVKTVNLISGIEKTKPIKGYSAKVYLKGIDMRKASSYSYFGGFEGEGDLTKKRELPSDYNITTVMMELEAGTDFKLHINDNFAGDFPKGSGNSSYMRPDTWTLDTSTHQYFQPGTNNITFNFTYISANFTGSGPKYIAGGFFRVDYETDNISQLGDYTNTKNHTIEKVNLPGIDGFINLYSSFYVPGNLSQMEMKLHYISNYTMFVNLGNITVFRNDSQKTGEEVEINNSHIMKVLNKSNTTLDSLSKKNIPLRIGLINITREISPFDIVLSTDTSGSMDDDCPLPGCKIEDAKNASNRLIDQVLSKKEPRVGLISYDSSTNSGETHMLSRNKTSLKDTVNGYTANGGTCVCCGVNSAVELLESSAANVLIPRKSGGWKYNDNNIPEPSNWNNLSFDDSSWEEGNTIFRNDYWSLGEPSTVINRYEGDYYFRKKFDISNISKISNATLKVLSDNGADIYVNGNLVHNNYGYSNENNAQYWNDELNVPVNYLNNGENIIAAKLYNRESCWWYWCWATEVAFDVELTVKPGENLTAGRPQAVILMTDGQTNYECSQQGYTPDLNGDGYPDRPEDDAIQSACDAYENHNIRVYTVGFGSGADENTLQEMSQCGDGDYYSSDNVNELVESYEEIYEEMVDYTKTQIGNSSSVEKSRLFSDSYISLNYTNDNSEESYGKIPLTVETDILGNNITKGTITIPDGADVKEARITSYSADKWTYTAAINNSAGYTTTYNLSKYGEDYHFLGDAFTIELPIDKLVTGNNTISVNTILENATGGSPRNKIIYNLMIRNSIDYTSVYDKANGCSWQVDYYDGTSDIFKVPEDYNGTKTCYYHNSTYDTTDAIDNAVYTLLTRMDFNNDGTLEVKVSEDKFQTGSLKISKVPTMWGPSEIEVRIWK